MSTICVLMISIPMGAMCILPAGTVCIPMGPYVKLLHQWEGFLCLKMWFVYLYAQSVHPWIQGTIICNKIPVGMFSISKCVLCSYSSFRYNMQSDTHGNLLELDQIPMGIRGISPKQFFTLTLSNTTVTPSSCVGEENKTIIIFIETRLQNTIGKIIKYR